MVKNLNEMRERIRESKSKVNKKIRELIPDELPPIKKATYEELKSYLDFINHPFFEFYLKCLKHASMSLQATALDQVNSYELGKVKGQDMGLRFLISILEETEIEMKRRIDPKERKIRETGKE